MNVKCQRCGDTGFMLEQSETGQHYNRWRCPACSTPLAETTESMPHPDTARADAAELMLYQVMKRIQDGRYNGGLVETYAAVPGLSDWYPYQRERLAAAVQLADLTARLERERAAVAATERELEELSR